MHLISAKVVEKCPNNYAAVEFTLDVVGQKYNCMRRIVIPIASKDFVLGVFHGGVDPNLCPPEIKGGVDRYIKGTPPGSFLRSVLENDLITAVSRADDENKFLLRHILAYICEHCPYQSHGAPGLVRAHLLRMEAKTDE